MLAAAHVFEALGYAPCHLCLLQREVYWGALTVAAAGLTLVRLARLPMAVVSLLLGAVFVVGVGLAAFHAGVEWKFWPGPTTCTGVMGGISASDLGGLLDGTTKVRAPACDQAAWRMLGLSMAGWNALVSAALAAISFVAAGRERRSA